VLSASVAVSPIATVTASFGGDALATAMLLTLLAASAIAGWSALYGP
jgi:hypothetical protein